MNDIINSSQAAKVIGCGPQMVRERMKRGAWKIGRVLTKEETGASSKNTYEVSKYKLAKEFDIDIHEVDRRLSG